MMKRLFWFLLGAAAGAYAAVWGKRKAVSVAESMTPQAVATAVIDGIRSLVKKAVALYNGSSDDPPPSVL